MPGLSRKAALEALYTRFNDPAWIHPDPLEFVVRYPQRPDREIVALVAACLAYGRVQTILKSVSTVLAPMEGRPREFIEAHPSGDFDKIYRPFVHRFTKGNQIARLMTGIKKVLEIHGSLYGGFLDRDIPDAETILPALAGFVRELERAAGGSLSFLLPDPAKGSAAKRLHLFLRWMVRQDRIDPGGWDGVSAARLIYPLDTHIHAAARRLGFTRRRSADIRTALEITERFRAFNPDDPVKYDFALARLGILKIDPEGLTFCRSDKSNP